MEVDSLSDQDLRRLLREHGVNSPVTDSTRNVLRKKLCKYIFCSPLGLNLYIIDLNKELSTYYR